MSTPSKPNTPSSASLAVLLASGLAMSGLAVYQWLELLFVLQGGKPSCAINDTLNCTAVWSSEFAQNVQKVTGMPVAALGLVWGLAATLLAAVLAVRVRLGKDTDTFRGAVKVVATVGALSCVTFLTASIAAKAICLTCLGTYLLVAVYALGALVMLPKPTWPTGPGLFSGAVWAAVVTAASFLALLYPALQTRPLQGAQAFAGPAKQSEEELLATLKAMPERDARYTSLARLAYTKGQVRDSSAYPARLVWGSPMAPARLVDFTDILCGHCRAFEQVTTQLRQIAPEGTLSVEPRYFPLDGECNPQIPTKHGDGVRCMGAKVQLCLEQSPAYWDVRGELFEKQNELTKDKIVDIAVAKGTLTREQLLACVQSPETQKKLNDDIIYAMLYNIEGTPLVLLNGRDIPPSPAFILAMALSKGDVNAPFFLTLPPPARE